MGGRIPLLFWIPVVALQLLNEVANASQPWWLGVWAQAYRSLAAVNVF
jgi:hypothetical protein